MFHFLGIVAIRNSITMRSQIHPRRSCRSVWLASCRIHCRKASTFTCIGSFRLWTASWCRATKNERKRTLVAAPRNRGICIFTTGASTFPVEITRALFDLTDGRETFPESKQLRFLFILRAENFDEGHWNCSSEGSTLWQPMTLFVVGVITRNE